MASIIKTSPSDTLNFDLFSNPVRAFFENNEVRTLGLLQLVTARQLTDARHVAKGRLSSVVNYLAARSLRLRGDKERFGLRLYKVYGDGKNAPVEALHLCFEDPTVPVLNVERLIGNLHDDGITTLGQLYNVRTQSGRMSRYLGVINYDVGEVRWMQGWLTGLFSP